MPVIKLDVLKMDRKVKADMIKEITEVAARYVGEPKEAFYVFVTEHEPDNVGAGGQMLSDILAEKK